MRRLIVLFVVSQTVSSFAQEALPSLVPVYGTRFQEIKTYQEQALRLGGTKSQLREIQRNILRAGYGDTGAQRLFGSYSPSPTIEGIDKTIRLSASDNPNQAKGYRRTLLYEKAFTKGGKYEVVATDKIVATRFGKTDIDLLLRDRLTGKLVFVEVKNSKLAGQNLQDYKLKVRRLADYAKQHGGQVVFLNRHEFRPEFQQYAKSRGVLTFDKVATGKLSSRAAGNLAFKEMEQALSQHVAGKPTIIHPPGHWIESSGKWLRRAGVVGLVASEGYIIHGFATGRLSEREFVTAQSAIVGGGLGGWAGATGGAAAGAAIGVWFGGVGAGPGALIGGIIGGIGGGFGGAKLAEMAASGFYGRLDQEQKLQVTASIYQYYGVSQ